MTGHDGTATHSAQPTNEAHWPTLENLRKLAEAEYDHLHPPQIEKAPCSSLKLKEIMNWHPLMWSRADTQEREMLNLMVGRYQRSF